jgi:hypothetical protein
MNSKVLSSLDVLQLYRLHTAESVKGAGLGDLILPENIFKYLTQLYLNSL